MYTYVIPDIHGRLDLLDDGFTKIIQHAAGRVGTIVAVGDYVDKGPDTRRVIDRLRLAPPDGWKLILLKGNHDAMMVQALRDESRIQFWLDRGGDAALQSYGGDPSDVPLADIEWLDKLLLMHTDTYRLYVHAGIEPNVPLDQQTERTLLWKRHPKDYQLGYGDRHLVHGHDSFVDGPKLYEGRTNLDTRAWRTGRMVIGVFDDEKPGGPIDFIKVIMPAT